MSKESVVQFPCPRCGAEPDWPCEPIRQPSKYPTILRMHTERGAMPWWLEERGYVKYALMDADGFKMHLYRKPSQPAVVREGWSETC